MLPIDWGGYGAITTIVADDAGDTLNVVTTLITAGADIAAGPDTEYNRQLAMSGNAHLVAFPRAVSLGLQPVPQRIFGRVSKLPDAVSQMTPTSPP